MNVTSDKTKRHVLIPRATEDCAKVGIGRWSFAASIQDGDVERVRKKSK